MTDVTDQPYAGWQQRIEDKINQIQVTVARLGETQQTPAEVDAKLATRVSTETYAADQRAVISRLERLEASPMKTVAWLGAIAGCAGTLIAAFGVTLSVVFWIILHYAK